MYQLEAIDFGRRMAVEKEIEKTETAPQPNAVFDESSNFLIYPTLLGIKVRQSVLSFHRIVQHPPPIKKEKKNPNILFLILFSVCRW